MALVIRSFSDGDARNSNGDGEKITPGPCPIAASMLLSHKEESSERSSCRRLLWVRSEKGSMSAHNPLERCHPHGHLTARKAGEHSGAVCLGSTRVEWICRESHQDWPPESKIPTQARRLEGE